MNIKGQSQPHGVVPKKVYRGAKLSTYGDVTQITRGSSGAAGDGGPGMSKPACWIAEALYGVDAPRTLLVRSWLLESYNQRKGWALVIVPLYRQFGQSVAAGVQRNSLLRDLFRPVFDFAVAKANRHFASEVVLRAA